VANKDLPRIADIDLNKSNVFDFRIYGDNIKDKKSPINFLGRLGATDDSLGMKVAPLQATLRRDTFQ
jgi:hypothetical protein